MQQTNMLPKAAYNFRTDTKDLNESIEYVAWKERFEMSLPGVARLAARQVIADES